MDDAAVAAWRASTTADTDTFLNLQPILPGKPKEYKGDIGTYLVRKDPQSGKWKVVDKTTGVDTDYGYVNGILGSLNDHAELGGRHMEMLPGGERITEYTLFNNPSRGFFADAWETLRDKLGFTTAPARALAGVLQDVQSSGKIVHWVAHSQGGAIFAEGMRRAGGDLSANSVTFNAGANNKTVTDRIAASVGVQVKAYIHSPFDAVPNVIGGNGNIITIPTSLLALPTLFIPGMSSHTVPTPSYRNY